MDPQRVRELTTREARVFEQRTPGSRDADARARRVLSGGVASSYQLHDPWPIRLARGNGAAVWDVDGNRMIDFHNGFGAMVQGHAHPAVTRVVAESVGAGSHLGAPSGDAVLVAQELARRWGLPKWRFATSGSETTMDAIRIARGFTGRDTVIKAFGSYHGHHDAVMVSVGAGEDPGDPLEMPSVPFGAGIPRAVADLTVAVPFNDTEALERRIEVLAAAGRLPACVILEPSMMLGLVAPEPGYLDAVREITTDHDVVLIFDEVKTGLCLAAGGAVQRYGVLPDLVTLAKALGAGLPAGAVGGTEQVMSVVEDRSVKQVGTYNGNPLAMAAARVSLLEILTPEAYAGLERLGSRLAEGCERVLRERGLAGYAFAVGARGCSTFWATRVIDYATLRASQDAELARLTWLYLVNRGIFTTPARPEQWLVTVAHADADVDAYVSAFGDLADALAG